MLADASVEEAQLEDPEGRLLLSLYLGLVRAAKRLTRDSALALRFGAEIDLAEISPIPHLDCDALTLDEAVAHLNRYSRIDIDLGGTMDRYRLIELRDELWLVDAKPDDISEPELTELGFAHIASMTRDLLGGRQLVVGLSVRHPPPPHRDSYDRVFGAPAVFSASRDALLLDPLAWQDGVEDGPTPPAYVTEVVTQHADQILERLNRSRTMRARVEETLLEVLPNGGATMREVSRRLGQSTGSLRRRLADENTTFDAVLLELRRQLALKYLADDGLSVSETSFKLGFADPAAFGRAFKRWTGSAPGNVRATSRRVNGER